MKYIIITAVFNEEKYIKETIMSVINQILPPKEWIIVDDNSTDNTFEIIKRFIRDYNWIKLIKNEGSKRKKEVGAKVVKAFNYGYQYVTHMDYDFLVKLDGDLILPQDYFMEVAKTFEKFPIIGICGGYCFNVFDDKQVIEKNASYHVRGAFKSIRKECWQDIGGFMEVLGWDGLDEMSAMYKGWTTLNLDIPVKHLRPTSTDYANFIFAKQKGIAAYKNGNNLLLTTIRAVVHVKKKPYIAYSLFYVIGYLAAMLKREKKNVSSELAKFINRFHMNRLLKLKRY